MSVESLRSFKPLHSQPSPEEQELKLREVADMYEKQFLREMVKAMRGSVQESGFVKVNQAEKIFREELDHEYVEKWGAKGGLGLSDVIYQQLIEKFGTRLGIRAPVAPPQGPLVLDERSKFTGPVQPVAQNAHQITYRFDCSEGMSLGKIQAPWSGNLLGTRQIDTDEYVLDVLHDNGWKSRLVFRGQLAPGLSKGPVQAGENIGILSPEAKSLFWTVETGPSPVSE